MKKFYFVVLLVPYLLMAQFAVVSTQPANNAKNVPLTATISITFNEALDTVAMNSEDIWFSNLNNDSVISYGYSADLKTTYGIYKLQPNTAYFVSFYYAKAKLGSVLTTPFVYYFTTGSDFPPYTVSGTVSSGATGVTPQDALIALATENIFESEQEGPPPFSMGALVNNDGSFTVPYLANGTYWPIAVKDVDHDGKINIENGTDVIAFGDSIVVNNGNITGLNLEFISFEPLTFAEAIDLADSLQQDIPNDCVLKQISAWDVDTLGKVNDWNFAYTRSASEGYEIRVSSFDSRVRPLNDPWHLEWLHSLRTLLNPELAAPLTTVISQVEDNGGRDFRRTLPQSDKRFMIEARLSDHNHDDFYWLVTDTNKFYWGVVYRFGYETDTNWYDVTEKRFLCDFTTGAVVAQSTNSVKEIQAEIPNGFVLNQNYPNPFNPSTTIRYAIPRQGFVSLKIYDLLGKEIATLVNEMQSAGWKEVQWNASRFASGMYLVKMQANNFIETKKILLLK